MKFILSLYLVFSISFSWAQVYLPKDFEIDVDHYYLKDLNVKQIIQSHSHKFKDSTYFRPEYVVDLDTLGRIKSFKYDFKLDFRTLKFDGVTIDFIVKDSSGLFQYDSLWYNFYTNNYIYDDIKLMSILINQPNRPIAYGVLDGVYIKEFKENLLIKHREEIYYSEGRISKIQKYDETGMLSEVKYSYKAFKYKQQEYFLKTKIVTKTRRYFGGTIGPFNYEESEIRIEYII
jgi:hypothetical protein